MITFFILLLLYVVLLPLLSYAIIQRRIRMIGKFRMVLNTRHAAHRIHNAIESWIGTDEGLVFDILKSRINKRGLIFNYHKFYGKNLMDELRDEFSNESYDKAYQLFKT